MIIVRMQWKSALLAAVILALSGAFGAPSSPAQSQPAPIGIFEDHKDVGALLHPGTALYEAATATYTLTGSGTNMWFAEDDFHFAWKKASGDLFLSADIAFTSETGNAHRKAVLMIRQSLDPGSPAVDIASHGNGLAALQFRLTPGGIDHEVEFNVSAPRRVRLEKRGEFFYAFAAGADGKILPMGAAIKLPLTGTFYVGIGVCAHDKDATTTATFRNVKLAPLPASSTKAILWSTLETVPISSTDRHALYVSPTHFEAPNWSRDSSFILFNQDGGIYHLPVSGGSPTRIDTGAQVKCNNDHGLSPDGTTLAISDSTTQGKSLVYTVPLAGGTPRQITTAAPSYWHGWSPDGQTLAFTGQRTFDGKLDFDIYAISVNGGEEHRLTTAPGLDDGPEYSPDGQWIYFNSERTGHMQIWRMHPDGSQQEQFVSSETNDWFPHISPDGKWMVYISFEAGVTGHPPDKDVELQVMSLTDKKTRILANLFGGQGTINVPSWSPDSAKVAFVSYEYLIDEPRE